ncbi:NACHT domain-containing protein [Actinokineospora auranticolor]|uniref:NACHT domain-containing protein n=1 Tax=Actinokineospora auranticolor TaxID=155976 RepID=A0A2S6GCP1_9PSEU|nr:NACHT domain-containing protein [Actinokineospora auranticolor]PPK62753.1 NACHT domain-containing protein [Actinokineospora auranticolor]
MRRWPQVLAGAVVLALLVLFAVLLLPDGGLDRSDKVASVLGLGVAVLTLLVTLFPKPGRAAGTPDDLGAVVDGVARAVRDQWESEEQIRRVHDPFPLPYRWTAADEAITDHWQAVNAAPDDDTPPELAGQGDHVVDLFRAIPSGRLVVLGEAGAGKTVLASRFVLTLLGERAPGAAVPVVFSLSSWDPDRVGSLSDWLVAELTSNYPSLGAVDGAGDTVAARLLAARLVLPVLDGFDEVPDGLRGTVLARINQGLRPDTRFLLTSRPEEYRSAVTSTGVLTAAAVVRLAPLTADDLDRYLPLTIRTVNGSREKWRPLLARTREPDAGGALREVLSTPLMVALARAVFSDTDADPERLAARGDSAAAIEDRLLAGFVPAVYADSDAGSAHRRLVFLAEHTVRLGTPDIAWWRLVQAVPRAVVGVVGFLVIASAVWFGMGFPGWVGHWPAGSGQGGWQVATVLAGAVCGAVGGAVVGQGRGIRPEPARMRLRLRGRLAQITARLRRGLRSWRTMVYLAVWVVGGTLFGLMASIGRDQGAILVGVAAGLFAGAGTWLVVSFISGLGTPIEPTDTTSPLDLLRIDRRTALRQGVAVGVVGSAVFWLTLYLGVEPAFGVPFEVVFADGLWLPGIAITATAGVAMWMMFATVWGAWLIARVWLALTGALPWATMAFLHDAYRRGVLRQVGGVYQFRHARLREYLARPR